MLNFFAMMKRRWSRLVRIDSRIREKSTRTNKKNEWWMFCSASYETRHMTHELTASSDILQRDRFRERRTCDEKKIHLIFERKDLDTIIASLSLKWQSYERNRSIDCANAETYDCDQLRLRRDEFVIVSAQQWNFFSRQFSRRDSERRASYAHAERASTQTRAIHRSSHEHFDERIWQDAKVWCRTKLLTRTSIHRSFFAYEIWFFVQSQHASSWWKSTCVRIARFISFEIVSTKTHFVFCNDHDDEQWQNQQNRSHQVRICHLSHQFIVMYNESSCLIFFLSMTDRTRAIFSISTTFTMIQHACAERWRFDRDNFVRNATEMNAQDFQSCFVENIQNHSLLSRTRQSRSDSNERARSLRTTSRSIKQQLHERQLSHVAVAELCTKHDRLSCQRTRRLLFVSCQNRVFFDSRTKHLILSEWMTCLIQQTRRSARCIDKCELEIDDDRRRSWWFDRTKFFAFAWSSSYDLVARCSCHARSISWSFHVNWFDIRARRLQRLCCRSQNMFAWHEIVAESATSSYAARHCQSI